MRSLFSFILIAILGFGLSTSSCINDDFTTSSSDILTFSADTLNFDTIFTDVGTPTARLRVYNKANKAVNISSIRFAEDNSYFRMNVDGMNSDSFSDVEIMAHDSIYIFIECFIPENSDKVPFRITDKIQFVTNGVLQEVALEAYGQNVIRLRGETISADTWMTNEQPYVVFDSLVVDEGATLYVDPGVQLLFHDKAKLVVKGTLKALGRPGEMIDMRGDRLDNVLTDTPYDLLAGQWQGIEFRPQSFGNKMEYVNMRSTVYGIQIDSCAILDTPKLTILNSWLHNSQGSVLKSNYAWVDAYGVCFSDAAEAVVSLTGGIHNFIQCTIANNYLFSAVYQPLLSLFHCMPDDMEENELPLMKASFENSIIYGLAADINQSDLTGSEVFLRNVLLKSPGEDDDNFIDCLWDSDPMFYTERNDYIFNYRLRPDSPAIGTGNPGYVNYLCIIDMDGLNRLSDGNPDLGAYVFVPTDE